MMDYQSLKIWQKYDTDFKDYIVTKIVIAFKGKECQVEYKI